MFNFVKRDYCNAGVSVVCLSVYHTIKCGRIVSKLYMDIYGYNTNIIKKYHRNRYNVKITKFVENS